MIRRLLPVLLLLITSACSEQETPGTPPDKATVFSFIDGSKKTLHDFTGQWLVINFWSVSCPPCFQEMPELARLYSNTDSDSFELIGVAMPYDRPDMILETQQRKQLPYPLAIDIQGEINRAFGIVQVVPTSFLLNPDGDIVWQHAGIVNYDALNKELMDQQSIYKERK